MGLADFFTIKSPRQREAEQQQFNAWAFPYGQQQRQIIQNRLDGLLPGEKKTGMALFLMGREAYLGGVGEDLSGYTQQQRLRYAARLLSDQLPGRHRPKLWRYLALILADEQVDGSLNYPSVEQLQQMAAELEAQG